ncbi:phage tail domain-containing protein [Mammaliicoccus sciuri]|uniref:phage tail domain-containing protein n=1 Tax=Mammaliicoccus sciuri TaxID=1296 RepID=UPI001FB378CC|nr:phage tail domain-containing protein [Mammaliicoccus sciuri]MCJ1765820.1 phage tail family protein [Mammaliicoccus sciuri]
MDEKWVRIFDDKSDIMLTDLDGLSFLEYEEEGVETRVTSTEVQGVDGVLMSLNTFGPFNLILRFFHRGADVKDYRLMKQQLRGMLHRRTPFYVVHSDMPGIKYAVYCEENAITNIGHKYGTFEVTFTVYKGYSESLYETNQYDKTSDKWQFGNGLLVNDDIKYKHNTTSFKIFNGSSDTIAPFPHRHKLIIKLNVNAPKGFKLINRTTGDVFEYKKAITKSKQIIINGIYPTIDGKRVGIDTNHEWLTLAPGYNDIEIIGTDITEPTAEFIFPFIYR